MGSVNQYTLRSTAAVSFGAEGAVESASEDSRFIASEAAMRWIQWNEETLQAAVRSPCGGYYKYATPLGGGQLAMEFLAGGLIAL
jgi:hypothetical protein